MASQSLSSFDFDFADDLAVMNEVGAIDEFEGFADVMVSDEDTEPAVLEAAQGFLDFVDSDWVDAIEGLIKHEKFGVGDEGAGDFQPTFFASTEGVGLVLSEGTEVEFVEEVFETEFSLLGVDFAGFEDGEDVFLD